MWMVVSEDPAGRLRYQYHNLPPPAAQPPPPPSAVSSNPSPISSAAASIYSSSPSSGHLSHMQRGFARGGCLSFPDPMGASPRTAHRSHTLPSGHHPYYEMEQYDNVNDYSSYGGPDSSSSTSSSAEYQDPVYSTRYGTSGSYARRQNYARCYVPISADTFYYYHQQQQQQKLQHPQPYRPRQRSAHRRDHSHHRAPSPDPDYSPPLSRNKVRFQLPNEPVSRGEYVSNTYQTQRHHMKVFNTEDFGDVEEDYEAVVSMDPNPAPHHESVLVHRSNGQVSVMVTKKEEPIYCSGGSDSAESSSATPSSVEAETPPPIPEHPPARHRLVKKSQKEIGTRTQNGIGSTPTRPFEITQAYGGTIRGPPMGIGGQGITPMGTMAAVPHTQTDGNAVSSGSSWFSKKDKNKKKDKKIKIKKEDISNPTNFQHKAHVGWNQDSGFSNTVYDDDMDEATRNILKAAGLESGNLNEDEKKFVKKYIAKNYDKYVSVGNLDSSQISAPLPPPQPIQQSWNQTPIRPYKPSFPVSAPIGGSSYSSSPVAPPPPTRVESHGLAPARPPPPPPASNNRGYAPSRPLPQAPTSYTSPQETRPHAVPPPPPPPPPSSGPAPISSSAPPPPPPPPPMPSGGIPSIGAGAPPPPPPPPPPSGGGVPSVIANLPPAQNGRSNLLAEIQAGKQLRSVQQSATDSPKTGDARGDVMAQIRQGAQLKHVDAAAEQERRKSTTGGAAGMGGLAGALAKALEERRMNMGIDDTSDEDEDEDEKNEWSD